MATAMARVDELAAGNLLRVCAKTGARSGRWVALTGVHRVFADAVATTHGQALSETPS